MSVLAVAVGLCALVIVALTSLVGHLHARLRRLSQRVAELDDERQPAGPATTVEPSQPSLRPPPVSVPAGPGLADLMPDALPNPPEVAVITAMPDDGLDDGLDVGARRVVSVSLARPLIKVVALSYGVRRALDDENRFKVRYAMRKEFRRQRKMRRRRRAARRPSMGWRS